MILEFNPKHLNGDESDNYIQFVVDEDGCCELTLGFGDKEDPDHRHAVMELSADYLAMICRTVLSGLGGTPTFEKDLTVSGRRTAPLTTRQALEQARDAVVLLCPDCGPVNKTDEDGCCFGCGSDVCHDADGKPHGGYATAHAISDLLASLEDDDG